MAVEHARVSPNDPPGEQRGLDARLLARSEALSRSGSWRLVLATGELTWSDGMFAVFGMDPGTDQVDADMWRRVVHPDDLAMVDEATAAAFAEGTHQAIDYRIVLPDGRTRWVHGDAEQEFDAQGEVVALVGYYQDVTDRKTAEDELAGSRRFLGSILDTSPNLIYIYDLVERRNVYANREVASFLGYTPQQIQAFGSGLFASILHPDDVAVVARHHVRAAKAPDGKVLECEYRMKHSSGEWRWLHSRDTAFSRGSDGRVAQILGSTEDVTERRLARSELEGHREKLKAMVAERTEQLERVNEQLAEASAAKSAFLASMSHELRTPLNSIIGFSGVLAQGLAGQLTPEQERQVHMVNASGRRLLELINEVLDLSIIEAGQTRFEITAVDVKALADGSAGSVEPLAKAKGLELSWHVEEDAGSIVSDRGRLSQVLLNLLGNAVKFTETGAVRLDVHREHDAVVFTVTDTGRGIPDAELPRIFDEFYQVERDDVAKSEGTGLGLTVSHRLLEALGGTIGVESKVGVGSTFTVRVPVGSPKKRSRVKAPAQAGLFGE